MTCTPAPSDLDAITRQDRWPLQRGSPDSNPQWPVVGRGRDRDDPTVCALQVPGSVEDGPHGERPHKVAHRVVVRDRLDLPGSCHEVESCYVAFPPDSSIVTDSMRAAFMGVDPSPPGRVGAVAILSTVPPLNNESKKQ